ncbi:tRNA (N6-isopentenyl adenosine(37)-C2)-methylthiotransferase MiaB [Candidatus Pelagibacter sp.]|uniref:tRNA (N6-isopentenyl adenosine(37)-C2)-methylthiotransferase MiaB n=1 Tax=Candidatus Pelagibacter sp. Uisw_134_02 TaxID=3230990 RepID=UPI002325BA48|nr:tRNA (N6-isopentenyl adenosine(37)-C2)-methylthiotransferase MiaB [Candidatus Pelagibacter sp.]
MGLKKNPNLMLKKIFIKTFGCQMNEYDSNRIFDTVKKIGFEKTDKYEDANCYILNTCHIRDKAKEKVYHEIGRVKKIFRSKKKPIVIVAGCVAQAENQEILKREPYIDIIIGPQSYHKINETIERYIKKKKKEEETEFDTISKFNYLSKIKNQDSKVSSFLTIQEGCDKFCHFCVVPYTRGPEYSRPFNQIINEAKEIVQSGAKEIILLGQNVNAYSYRDENRKFRLSDILIELENFSELERIRYTTSHPKDMTDDLINVYKKSIKLMPLVHLPVQSGSNKILKLMNRKHTIEEYLLIYEKLKKINPNIEFSSDFIVGYPEENDDDFSQTIKLIEKVKFTNSYSFIFSPRPGTVAAGHELVDKKKSKERLEKIQKKLFENQLNKNKSLEGKILKVLVENQMKDGIKLFGRTEYMTPVIFDGSFDYIGKIIKLEIKSSNQNSLFGIIKENYKKKVA